MVKGDIKVPHFIYIGEISIDLVDGVITMEHWSLVVGQFFVDELSVFKLVSSLQIEADWAISSNNFSRFTKVE